MSFCWWSLFLFSFYEIYSEIVKKSDKICLENIFPEKMSPKESDEPNSNNSQNRNTENNYSDVELDVTMETNTKSLNQIYFESPTSSDTVDEDVTTVIAENQYIQCFTKSSKNHLKQKTFSSKCCKWDKLFVN